MLVIVDERWSTIELAGSSREGERGSADRFAAPIVDATGHGRTVRFVHMESTGGGNLGGDGQPNVAMTGRVARAVFLDKDGTLIENVPYNVDPERVLLAPGAADALRALASVGYLIVVISNQSGVARGVFDVSRLAEVERALRDLLSDEGVSLDGFYFCPHLPDGTVAEYAIACECRKPAPGLVLRAADELGIDLERSWVVGDILDDVEAGRAAGCRTVLVDVGSETEWIRSPAREPDHVVGDLPSAADVILKTPSLDPSRTETMR
jgi:D-glycero-D-manno-heptose 1,7-bisphosphate phosphatase